MTAVHSTFMLSGVWAAPLASEEVDGQEPTPDVLLGAYLLGHLETHTCENCGTHETPQWRKGWVSEVLGRAVLLCNACGIKYHKNQFCSYCREIYGREVSAGSGWTACQKCRKLDHDKCRAFYKYGDTALRAEDTPESHCCAGCSGVAGFPNRLPAPTSGQ